TTRGQRDDRTERIDGPGPLVSSRAETARAPRRQVVMGRALHLQDDRLFECYLAQRQGEAADPPAVEHLADCESCAARYTELALVMDGVRAEGDAEADEAFTPERLRAQQQQIARRMEA